MEPAEEKSLARVKCDILVSSTLPKSISGVNLDSSIKFAESHCCLIHIWSSVLSCPTLTAPSVSSNKMDTHKWSYKQSFIVKTPSHRSRRYFHTNCSGMIRNELRYSCCLRTEDTRKRSSTGVVTRCRPESGLLKTQFSE
ncbi:hypothetical protein AVEN_44015-1 [Araneus ventricosus]|uniref:Uncharacterized protein n=1 Tax=Araneus ventricosus TaxID=182803 RepID=A0A4Y2RRY2_ARAVE|nr:hypothetical protein AVEN_44015-1 [Araneus ventricosus]